MLRKRTSRIAYLVALVVIAAPVWSVWALVAASHRPERWVSIAFGVGLGLAIAFLTDPVTSALLRWWGRRGKVAS